MLIHSGLGPSHHTLIKPSHGKSNEQPHFDLKKDTHKAQDTHTVEQASIKPKPKIKFEGYSIEPTGNGRAYASYQSAATLNQTTESLGQHIDKYI